MDTIGPARSLDRRNGFSKAVRPSAFRIFLPAMAGLFLLLNAACAGNGAFATEPAAAAATAAWQTLLDQAEPIYQASDYKNALPLYEQAATAASSKNATTQQRIHCLRYLADCYIRTNQPEKAFQQYEKISSLAPSGDVENQVASLNDEAACYGVQGNYDKGIALCLSAIKLCTNKPELLWQLARTHAQLAYFDYMRSKFEEAIPEFQKAEQLAVQSGRSDVVSALFLQKMAFAQAGSYYHLRRFDEAYKQFQKMYDDNVRLFGKTDLQTGWAMLALSDVLAKLNQPQQAAEWYGKAVFVFRKYNKDRICKEFGTNGTCSADLEKRISDYIFGISKPPAAMEDSQPPLCRDSLALINTHDPRSLYARPFTDAPGRVWLDPMVPQKGIVIAIHGLSLNHNSFDALATELAHAGFSTVAFDVRGFGTYRQALGAERIDFDNCMRDLQLVVGAIRSNNPGKPLFILGESMGGAIALQFAAQNPSLVDGLIASVPAGKRFNQKRTTVKVAMRFLENKNRPFDIGTDVINQATTDPKVKQSWSENPITRSTLSPKELMAFQSMLNRNLKFAKQIVSTPVVIFQGVSDGLVKPEATYDLFRAIGCKDKSFIMVGNAEHLIFEEGCFTPAVVKGLEAWMESHGKPATS